MSKVIKGIGKVFKAVGKVVLKALPFVLAAAAVVFTGGAALGLGFAAGGWGAAAGGIGTALGGSGTLGTILGGAITQAGYGAALGGITGGKKGMVAGAIGGALTGGVGGALGMNTDPLSGLFDKPTVANSMPGGGFVNDAASAANNIGQNAVPSAAEALSQPLAVSNGATQTLAAGQSAVTQGLLNGGSSLVSTQTPGTTAGGSSTVANALSGVGGALENQALIKSKYKGEMKLQMQEQDYKRQNYTSGTRGLLVGDYQEAGEESPLPEPVTEMARAPDPAPYSGGRYAYDPAAGRIVFKQVTSVTGAPAGYA